MLLVCSSDRPIVLVHGTEICAYPYGPYDMVEYQGQLAEIKTRWHI